MANRGVPQLHLPMSGEMLLALQLVSKDRAPAAQPEVLYALQRAGFVARQGDEWRLTAAGLRRVRPIGDRLDEMMARRLEP